MKRALLPNLGRINRNQSQHSSYRVRIGSSGGRPVKSRSNGIPSIPRNHGKRGGRYPPSTLTLQLQDRSAGRKYGAMGAHLPPLKRRTPGLERMANRNGKNGENQALHIPSWLTNPLRAETTRMRTTPICGLPSPKSDHAPQSVPTTSHAGAARSGPRGAMAHEDGPQKWISPDPNPRRGRMENSVQNPIRTFPIPSYAIRAYQRPLHLPRHDEPYLFRHDQHVSQYHGQQERREESHPFYLRAGGACFLYIHWQALPAPSHSFFRRCAACRLPSGPSLLPSSLGGAVPVRCCFGMLPSGNVPSRANMHLHDTYPMHPYRLRVTIALNFVRHPRCPQRKPEKTCKIAKLITKR